MTVRHFRCYAHGSDSSWEGICIDLDLAVQGRLLEEVKQLLNDAVVTYIDDASHEDPAVAARLLNRKAPFGTRAKLGLSRLAHLFAARRHEHQTSFELPCHV